jgi:hypothetical protein
MKNIVTISILSFFCVYPLYAQEGLDKVKAEIDSSVGEMSDSYKGKFDSYFVPLVHSVPITVSQSAVVMGSFD